MGYRYVTLVLRINLELSTRKRVACCMSYPLYSKFIVFEPLRRGSALHAACLIRFTVFSIVFEPLRRGSAFHAGPLRRGSAFHAGLAWCFAVADGVPFGVW